MDQIVRYPESSFGQGMEVTCIWLNRDWFSSLLLFAPTEMCSIFDVSPQTMGTSTRAIEPVRFPFDHYLRQGGAVPTRRFTSYNRPSAETLGLCVESLAPITAQSWKEGGESKETWLRPILYKSHHCRWAEFTPQKFFLLHFSVGRVRFALAFCLGCANSQGWGKC